MKITAVHSGGDWYDAAADYLICPEGMDFEAEGVAWRAWYRDTYCPTVRTRGHAPKVEYMGFSQWLVHRGARFATEEEIEIVESP